MGKYTNPAEAQVQEWEEKYGKLRVVVLEEEGEEPMKLYFKKINYDTLKLAMKCISKEKDSVKYAEIILHNTFLGDRAVLEDTDVFVALMPKVDEMISTKVALLEKK